MTRSGRSASAAGRERKGKALLLGRPPALPGSGPRPLASLLGAEAGLVAGAALAGRLPAALRGKSSGHRLVADDVAAGRALHALAHRKERTTRPPGLASRFRSRHGRRLHATSATGTLLMLRIEAA